MNKRQFTVELWLDVVAKDATEAEQIGRSLARYGAREARGIENAGVSDIRPDEDWENRQADNKDSA